MLYWRDLFTPRQLVALTTFSDLVQEATECIRRDAAGSRLPDDGQPLRDGGTGATAYAEAVAVYLAFALSKQADLANNLCRWEPVAQCPRNLFGRQAVPMIWDYAEGNPLGDASGGWTVLVDGIVRAFSRAFGGNLQNGAVGSARQADAGILDLSGHRVMATDPPYYDNIGYADLSDFFYVWLRRTLGHIFPELFTTLAAPKAEELVATPHRHGGKEEAERFFLSGMTQAMGRLSAQAHPGFPAAIFYAFKQSETKVATGTASTGWETFLDAAIRSGFSITGTWPMRTELNNRMTGMGTNALASSIVLVCRRRPAAASAATRREFMTALRAELSQALRLLQSGNVAPVDLAQAAIGPGMAVYTRYERVRRWKSGHSLSARLCHLPDSRPAFRRPSIPGGHSRSQMRSQRRGWSFGPSRRRNIHPALGEPVTPRAARSASRPRTGRGAGDDRPAGPGASLPGSQKRWGPFLPAEPAPSAPGRDRSRRLSRSNRRHHPRPQGMGGGVPAGGPPHPRRPWEAECPQQGNRMDSTKQ